jgi:hypothetical protein
MGQPCEFYLSQDGAGQIGVLKGSHKPMADTFSV